MIHANRRIKKILAMLHISSLKDYQIVNFFKNILYLKTKSYQLLLIYFNPNIDAIKVAIKNNLQKLAGS